MGELSKKIGEKGEKLVSNFLTILGWNDFQEGESINCRYSEKHQLKKTHQEKPMELMYFILPDHNFKTTPWIM